LRLIDFVRKNSY